MDYSSLFSIQWLHQTPNPANMYKDVPTKFRSSFIVQLGDTDHSQIALQMWEKIHTLEKSSQIN